jgi:LacI family gluconate utilization system Gnt-I transcriptional repressor
MSPETRPVPHETPRRPRPVATLQDVAALAEVSAVTVSRALKTPDLLSADTLKRVREAVAKTGYVPNLVAGGLRSARSGLVAALVPVLRSHLFDQAIQALTERLGAAGYQLLLGQLGYDAADHGTILRAVVGRRPDGIVMIGQVRDRDSRAMLMNSGIPVIEAGDLSSTPVDMLVGFSSEQIGGAAARYLIRKGHRALAVFSGDDERARRRIAGFTAAMAEIAGLPPAQVLMAPAPTTHAAGRRLLAQLCDAGQPIDAVFCTSDIMAVGVMSEARVRGIRVPEQLAVMGLGDSDFAASESPSLTTVRTGGTRMGELCAQFLLDRFAGRTVAEPIVDVGFTIVERDSA